MQKKINVLRQIKTCNVKLQAHFIKLRLNVRYRNTHLALNVDLIAVLRLIKLPLKASLKYDAANGIRIRRSLQFTSGNSNRDFIQKEVNETGLYMLFKVKSD